MRSMQEMFNYMARPENATNAVMFIIVYSLFVMLMGVGLAWVISILIENRVNKPMSFDDFIDHTNKQSGFKIRRVK